MRLDPISAAQLPKTNSLSKRELNRRRIVSDDEDLEVQRPPVVKSPEFEKKFKTEIPPVVTLESSSDDDEEPNRYCVYVFHSIICFIFIFCI